MSVHCPDPGAGTGRVLAGPAAQCSPRTRQRSRAVVLSFHHASAGSARRSRRR